MMDAAPSPVGSYSGQGSERAAPRAAHSAGAGGGGHVGRHDGAARGAATRRPGLLDKLRALDAFPKAQDDGFWERTNAGAAVSVCAVLCMLVLFTAELSHFLSVDVVEHMGVDGGAAAGEQLAIHFDVTFPHMACSVVGLDAMDLSGAQQLEVMHNVYKRRLDANGKPFGASEKNERGTLTTKEQLLSAAAEAGADQGASGLSDGNAAPGDDTPTCGSCYGAGTPGQCCSRCEEVRDLYRKKGWAFHASTVRQCRDEGFVEDVAATSGEGCNIYGYLEVPKVQGNFHFAPGHSFQSATTHVHDLLSFTVGQFNLTHTINKLSFGPEFPGVTNPLDGYVKELPADQTGMFQYYATVVPTTYVYKDGREVLTNQYSVTEHFKKLQPETTEGLPGVFVYYELSPIRAHIEERRRSFLHFLTRVCAIVGGVFTMLGLVDQVVHRVADKMSRGHNPFS